MIRFLLVGLCYLWAAPWTLVGLFVGLLVRTLGRSADVEHERCRGTIGVFGPGVATLLKKAPIPGGAKAMTLGHCILAVDRAAYHETLPHEWIHVKQYQWFGPLFVPAYFLESAWQWARGRDPYFDNRFEKQAYYWEKSIRWPAETHHRENLNEEA